MTLLPQLLRPLSAIRVFEAAARPGGFTRATEEPDMTRRPAC